MKKIVVLCMVSAFVLSCKKPPVGSNKNVIKLEEGVERYDTYERRTGGAAHAGAGEGTAAHSTSAPSGAQGDLGNAMHTDSSAAVTGKPAAADAKKDTVTKH